MSGCWKLNVLRKKALFPVKKKQNGIFFPSYRTGRTSKNISESTEVFLTNSEQVMFFSIEPKLSLETNISQKADAVVTEEFGLSFLVLSGFTNLADEFIRFHEVFGQLL